jgi:hypothetical protein
MDDKQYLHGVGGWLSLLIVGLCVLGPLLGFGRTSADIGAAERITPALLNMGEWKSYKQYTWWVLSFSALLSFSAGFRLLKIHNPESVRFAIIALWSINFITIAGQAIIVLITFGVEVLETTGFEFFTSAFSAIIGATLWTLYLLRSRRVKNTYYKNQPLSLRPS